MLQLNDTTMSLERVEDIVVIRPHGDLDLAKEDLLTQTLHSLLTAQHHKVIIDLIDVNHINYQLLGRLGEVVPLFREFGGDVCFVGASAYLRKIFLVTAAEVHWLQFASLSTAVLNFSEWPSQQWAVH